MRIKEQSVNNIIRQVEINSSKLWIKKNNRKKDANKKEKLSKSCRKSTSIKIMTKITNKIINKKISTNKHKVKINQNSSIMANRMIFNRIKRRISFKSLIKMILIR